MWSTWPTWSASASLVSLGTGAFFFLAGQAVDGSIMKGSAVGCSIMCRGKLGNKGLSTIKANAGMSKLGRTRCEVSQLGVIGVEAL